MVVIESARICEDRRFNPIEARVATSPELSTRGEALASLDASELRARFYSWRGVSGRRFICSVFSGDEQAIVAGFSSAAVIGVASDGLSRRPVCVMSSREFQAPESAQVQSDAIAVGVNEWHVHFGMDDIGLRDLAASLLN